MSRGKGLWAIVLSICLCNALSSVPVAANPIVTTDTISTVVPSFVTIYSVLPATEHSDTNSAITSTISGQQTILTPPGSVIAGSVTSTIISTISLTTTEVVVRTIGYSTVLAPDPATPTTLSILSVPVSDTGLSSSLSSSIVASTQTPFIPATVLITSSKGFPGSTPVISLGSSVPSILTQDIVSSTATAPSTTPTFSTPSTLSHSSSHSLSAGAKAGIGIGASLGILGLIIASFFLGRRFSHRSKADGAENSTSLAPGITEQKDTFHAGRPYEDSRPTYDGSGPLSPKNVYSGTTTEVGSDIFNRESFSTASPVMPAYQNNGQGLSALPQVQSDDPMYIGVPSHMSGSKRWSMKEYER